MLGLVAVFLLVGDNHHQTLSGIETGRARDLVQAAGRDNHHQTLSGIETWCWDWWRCFCWWATIITKPFQGLKLGERGIWSKRRGATIITKPFQGLKHKPNLLWASATEASDNHHQTLSGIETLPLALIQVLLNATIITKPFQGLKLQQILLYLDCKQATIITKPFQGLKQKLKAEILANKCDNHHQTLSGIETHKMLLAIVEYLRQSSPNPFRD